MLKLPKGIHKVKKTMKDGSKEVYYYAWRGGPRIIAVPGSPEFHIAYGAALQTRREPDDKVFLSLIINYRKSHAFDKLAKSTKHYRTIYLDEIQIRFGDMPIAALNDVSVKEIFVNWRDENADRPKAADMRIETLRVVLSNAVERGRIEANHAKGIGKLYENSRADVIWMPKEIELLLAGTTPECQRAIDLARLTGLRKGDLMDITWEADKGEYIEWETSKTGKRVFVPILPELREKLDSWPRIHECILTNSFGNPWKSSSLQSAFRRAKIAAGIDKRFHDLRGTFATMLIENGVTDERVADIMGWSKYKIEEIRRVYVDNSAIIKDVLRQINVNRAVKSKLEEPKNPSIP